MRNGGVDHGRRPGGPAARLFPRLRPRHGRRFRRNRREPGSPPTERLQFGNMVLSRWPIVVVAQPAPAAHAAASAAAICSAPRSKRWSWRPRGAIRVYSVHLDHVSQRRTLGCRSAISRSASTPIRWRAARSPASAEYGFPELPCPEEFILMGDFNMVRGSPEYVLMTGQAGGSEGHLIVAHHPVDMFSLGDGVPQGRGKLGRRRPSPRQSPDRLRLRARGPGVARRQGLDRQRRRRLRPSAGLVRTGLTGRRVGASRQASAAAPSFSGSPRSCGRAGSARPAPGRRRSS